ncbi:uncharacterized protein LOC133830234 [Humulus lupulus]|uniref:uncharacterized protein LOC133830234 n=1 Tax=Humulus lupulus TaxID=3486 RepID=UPI002B40F430|nr:uncharacterized protein LOC133830234 [Humulus lupulus]
MAAKAEEFIRLLQGDISQQLKLAGEYSNLTYITNSQQLKDNHSIYLESTQRNTWTRRKNGLSIGRIYFVHPSTGERFYLRKLLNFVKESTSYESIRTINGVTYPNFKGACYALGLLDDYKEWIDCLTEAAIWATGKDLRHLFVMILIHCQVSDASQLWKSNYIALSEDITSSQRKRFRMNDLKLTEQQVEAYTLFEIESIMMKMGKSLKDIDGMPLPNPSLIRDSAELTCEIQQGTLLARLLVKTSLIIWDEAPMANKFFFESLDNTLRNILRTRFENSSNKPFRGLTIIGDGSLYDDIDRKLIKLPSDIAINPSQDPLKSIVEVIYPSLLQKYNDSAYLTERAILTPKNEMVYELNEMIMNIIPGEGRTYFSSNSICKASVKTNDEDLLYPAEFLHNLKFNGIPNHEMRLKEGAPVMLLRNLNQTEGLCNGTRLIIKRLGKWSIRGDIISRTNIGENVTIPRIIMSPNESRWPFNLNRRQLPLEPCFSMTINKSQGKSLKHVGLYLPKQVFTHGQLYVVVSRVTIREGLIILNVDDEMLSDAYVV